jgi:hypothetical protein
MKTYKLNKFILYTPDYILRDSKGNPIRYKTNKEIKKEIQETLK